MCVRRCLQTGSLDFSSRQHQLERERERLLVSVHAASFAIARSLAAVLRVPCLYHLQWRL